MSRAAALVRELFAPSRADEPALSTALRTWVYAITAAAFTFPFATAFASFGAFVGASAGALAARFVARSSLRPHVFVWGPALLVAVFTFIAATLARQSWLASLLSPAIALQLIDFTLLATSSCVIAMGLRAATIRHRPLAFIEVAFVAAAFAGLLVSHRNGAIHRPYAIADWMLERGGDPSIVVMLIGTLATITIGLLLLSERSLVRSVLHVLVIFALLFAVLAYTHVAGPPPPPPAGDGLSLRDGAPNQENQGNGGGGRSEGGPKFQDEVNRDDAQTPLALVLLHDDYSPPNGVYYFRQESFSQYNGRRLVAATLDGVDEDQLDRFPARATDVTDAPLAGAFRSTVETTVGLLADHAHPFGLESPLAFYPASNPDSQRFRRVYRVRSAVITAEGYALVGRRAGDASWSPEVVAHYTHAPDDPRYAELARTIVAELPEELREDPYAKALAITEWLGREGIYSLRSRHANAPDPTADFLFGDRTGYCVHFAHAATYLMRSIGIPARVSTGYMSPESGRRGGSAIMLAGQNSHAWPEVRLDGVGWVVADVSPERALDQGPGNPDEELQQLLAELLRGNRILPDDGTEPPTPIDELAATARQWLEGGSLALVLLVLVASYLVKGYRSLAPRFASERDLPRLAYRAALDRLGEVGVVRDEGESRLAFSERLTTYPSLGALTQGFERAYFGSTSVDAAEIRRLLVAMARERRAAIPLHRRLLGALHPFSFFFTR